MENLIWNPINFKNEKEFKELKKSQYNYFKSEMGKFMMILQKFFCHISKKFEKI